MKTCPYCSRTNVKFSREHIISSTVLREVFGNPVKNRVSGELFGKTSVLDNEPTSKHVCKDCNSKLSPCDTAGRDLVLQIMSRASVANTSVDFPTLRLNWLIKTHLNFLIVTRPQTKSNYVNLQGLFDSLIDLKPVPRHLYALCLEALDTDASYFDGTRKEGVGYFHYRSVDFLSQQTIVSTLRIKSLTTYLVLPLSANYWGFPARVDDTLDEMRRVFDINVQQVTAECLEKSTSVLVSQIFSREKTDAILRAEAAAAAS